MKRKNREINIFSMSALDLFASAMGAFLLIAVMSLPYYLKTDHNLVDEIEKLKNKIILVKAQLSDLQQQNEELQKKLETSQSENNERNKQLEICQEKNKELQNKNTQLEEQAKQMQKKLSKTFCAINMNWSSSENQDIDMYVIDPRGRNYNFARNSRKYSGSDAMFTVDSRGVKDGAEVWITSELDPGEYKIYYRYYSGTGPVNVHGRVFTKSFTKDLPIKKMDSPDNSTKKHIATITVDANGNASLETF